MLSTGACRFVNGFDPVAMLSPSASTGKRQRTNLRDVLVGGGWWYARNPYSRLRRSLLRENSNHSRSFAGPFRFIIRQTHRQMAFVRIGRLKESRLRYCEIYAASVEELVSGELSQRATPGMSCSVKGHLQRDRQRHGILHYFLNSLFHTRDSRALFRAGKPDAVM